MNYNEWEQFVTTRPEANFLQSAAWGKLHEDRGDVVVRRVIKENDTVVAGWQGIVKNARRGRYVEVPGGPLADWRSPEIAQRLHAQLVEVARAHKAAFVRIRPQVEASGAIEQILRDVGFRKAPFHLHAEHTNILDLEPSEETLLAGMRRQTRYEVRRAAKQSIAVTWSSDETAVDEFFEVQADTARRHGFIPPSSSFLHATVKAFGDDVRIYRAEKDGVLLNLAMVIFSGDEADYHEAASTINSRNFAGAYGLQWQAIRDAKSLGKKRYNFWGIAYSDDPTHRYAGVTTFKRGFGGDDVTYVPAHDVVVDRARYALNWTVETIRRKKRKL